MRGTSAICPERERSQMRVLSRRFFGNWPKGIVDFIIFRMIELFIVSFEAGWFFCF